MKVEDKLENLRKSMKNTSLKDVKADPQEVKSYVLRKKKNPASLLGGTRKVMQWGASVVGVAALCFLMVYMSGGDLSQIQSTQPGDEGYKEPFHADEEGNYEVVVVHNGDKLEDLEWKYITNKMPIETIVTRNTVLPMSSQQGAQLIERYPFKKQALDGPVAYVFNEEQLVFQTDSKETLEDFLPMLYNAPNVKEELGEYPVAGVTLGQPLSEAINQIGAPDEVNKATDSQGSVGSVIYKDNGKMVLTLSVNEDHRINGMNIYQNQAQSEEWKSRISMNTEQVIERYGQPEQTSKIPCFSHDGVCTIYQYGEMVMKVDGGNGNVQQISIIEESLLKDEYKAEEKGKYHAVYISGSKTQEDWQTLLQNEMEGLLSSFQTLKEPIRDVDDFRFIVQYDLKKTPVVVLFDYRGEMIFKTNDRQELEQFLLQK